MESDLLKITSHQMRDTLDTLFTKYGFSEKKATLLSKTYTETTLDGVNSHGINRVPLFIQYVERGLVQIDKEAQKVESFGSIERWDGNLGPGIINAIKCTDRAIELAKENGMGMVALRNTNHWMRGGTYGWRAADNGCISILFTNTQPN
ncbi:MAG: 2,3-diketo-L-gulonate reductase, partial [Pricia sp.]|nr:2,3-diketo-L-gulonate reductase [Pricia sp.]